ncbi:MAG: C45 family peptidase [Clostridiaceae bacterium]|nr:C45 family peptidase [Clostridiaceae bacterium]
MNKFPVIEITADTPFERGVQYGVQAEEYIKICIEYYRRKFEDGGQAWSQIVKYAMGYAPVIEERMPEVMEEAKGVASGSGQDIGDIMAVNCRYEITKLPKVPECTTAAILPQASGSGKTYAVKNWDFSSGVMPHLVLLHIHTKEYSAIGWTEAGQMMREGFNSFGVAICNNALQSIHDYGGTGIPVTFLRRKVLACSSFEEAVELVRDVPRCVSNNIMIVGAEGKVCNMEVFPGHIDVVEPEDGIVTHANHFVVTPEVDAFPNRAKNRDTRLYYLLNKRNGSIDVEYIKECMKDHEYYPLSICGHVNPNGDAYSRDRMTVASMIIDFAENTAHICYGNPCEGEYIAYKL